MTDLFPITGLTDHVDADSWTPTNLNALPDTPAIEPTLGATGLLYPGKRHVFSGPPESAKTLAAYCCLILVARQNATAILIDFEMGARDAKKRLQELGATPHEIDQIPYLEPDQPATPQRLAALVDLQPQLVVIDAAAGAYQAEGLDDNKRSDVERFSRLYVGAFWLAGIATIVIDHVVKNVEGRGKFVIGSERKLGSSDVHLGFDTIQPISRGTTGKYKITTHKDRGGCLKRGHIADLQLDSDPDTHQIEWTVVSPEQTTDTEGHFRPTHLMEKASIFIELAAEPPNRNTVNKEIEGRKGYVLKAIDALVREEYITETEGPGRTKLLHHTRRYREATDDYTPDDNPVDNPPHVWFRSGSPVVPGTEDSGGSPSSSLRSRELGSLPLTDHPEPEGWFRTNGTLADAYYDTLTPDSDPEADPNP